MIDRGAGDSRYHASMSEPTSTEYSGSLSWDDFQLAIDQLQPFSQKLGDCWIKENDQSHLPGGTFLSYTRYVEIETSLIKCDYHIVLHFCKWRGVENLSYFSSTELLSEKLNSKIGIEDLIKYECQGQIEEVSKDLSGISGWMDAYQYILNAVNNETVTEKMMEVAVTKFPKKLHFQIVETYAQQLIAKDEKLKAVDSLSLIGKYEKVIRILLWKGDYHQAILLGKQFLDTNSELMEEIYEKAVAHFIKIRSYSVATKILCSIGKYAEALARIESLNHKYTLETAIYLAEKTRDNIKAGELRNRLNTILSS